MLFASSSTPGAANKTVRACAAREDGRMVAEGDVEFSSHGETGCSEMVED